MSQCTRLRTMHKRQIRMLRKTTPGTWWPHRQTWLGRSSRVTARPKRQAVPLHGFNLPEQFSPLSHGFSRLAVTPVGSTRLNRPLRHREAIIRVERILQKPRGYRSIIAKLSIESIPGRITTSGCTRVSKPGRISRATNPSPTAQHQCFD